MKARKAPKPKATGIPITKVSDAEAEMERTRQRAHDAKIELKKAKKAFRQAKKAAKLARKVFKKLSRKAKEKRLPRRSTKPLLPSREGSSEPVAAASVVATA